VSFLTERIGATSYRVGDPSGLMAGMSGHVIVTPP
jgi:hypothetical protein